jgi:hypothetical protein
MPFFNKKVIYLFFNIILLVFIFYHIFTNKIITGLFFVIFNFFENQNQIIINHPCFLLSMSSSFFLLLSTLIFFILLFVHIQFCITIIIKNKLKLLSVSLCKSTVKRWAVSFFFFFLFFFFSYAFMVFFFLPFSLCFFLLMNFFCLI